jgi:hypothetical protein
MTILVSIASLLILCYFTYYIISTFKFSKTYLVKERLLNPYVKILREIKETAKNLIGTKNSDLLFLNILENCDKLLAKINDEFLLGGLQDVPSKFKNILEGDGNINPQDIKDFFYRKKLIVNESNIDFFKRFFEVNNIYFSAEFIDYVVDEYNENKEFENEDCKLIAKMVAYLSMVDYEKGIANFWDKTYFNPIKKKNNGMD